MLCCVCEDGHTQLSGCFLEGQVQFEWPDHSKNINLPHTIGAFKGLQSAVNDMLVCVSTPLDHKLDPGIVLNCYLHLNATAQRGGGALRLCSSSSTHRAQGVNTRQQ